MRLVGVAAAGLALAIAAESVTYPARGSQTRGRRRDRRPAEVAVLDCQSGWATMVHGFVRFPLLRLLLVVILQHVSCLTGRRDPPWLVDLLWC
jgi:hypothetical protein